MEASDGTRSGPGDAAGALAASQFQRDLYLYWRAARAAGSLSRGARGYLTRAALRRVRERTPPADASGGHDGDLASELDDPRLFFLRRLAQRLSLLREDTDEALAAAEPSEMARFLALPFAERLRLCVRLWVAGGWWSDRPDAQREPPRLLAPAPPRVALARRQLLQTLLDLPAGATVPVPPPHIAPRIAGPATPPRGAGRGRSGRGEEEANLLDESARAALLGPLQWLGMVERVSGARARGAELCRTLPALDALRHPPAPVPEAAGKVVVQANFDVIALPPLSAMTLFLLDTCAAPRGGGQAATYTLTRATFAAAQRASWMRDGVAAHLERLTGAPLPQNVRVTLADWERQVHRLRLRAHATILEVDDTALLDRLLADPRAAEWVERRLTPHAALLDPRHVAAVRTWLLRCGEMPALLPSPPPATP
jgi:hypothetical protein